ncbi:glycerate kinase [Antrihabitans stalactiti]|uniref:Glycerate kinase n=1 Tax=Antrihabitans stalactiti TaxID=2584121 RepID=A0A848KAK7_9NOCA|nr:glycerate kinase [Antrihabitans stalactiti]NMN95359.1 glycerate kinase [Antrihabitans stalactiti]
MQIVIAPDKFKGSLSASGVAAALRRGVLAAHPDWTVRCAPVADGGDGTVAAAIAAGYDAVHVDTVGPTGVASTATYAMRADRAVVELANAVGLVLLPDGRLDPLGASTFGLGVVIRHALDRGAAEVVIGLGGSASTDGGAGMLTALGAKVLDESDSVVGRGGAALLDAVRLDLGALHPAVAHTQFVLACDVDSPLVGPNGATAVFGRQKGATDEDLRILEAAMTRWAEIATAATGLDPRDEAGAGAAGGTGFGAMAVLGAKQRSGIDIVLELIDFDAQLAGADLVVTGEGSLDEQSLQGKAPVGVASRAKATGVRVVAVAGRSVLTPEQLHAAGIEAVHTLAELEPDLQRSMANAEALLEQLGRNLVL